MKKLLLLLGLVATICLSSCTSSFFGKTAQAYEEATKKLTAATSEDAQNAVHDELMLALFNITKEYPDWQKIVKEEKPDSKAVKEVTDSYDTWNKALKESVKDDGYVYLPLCNFQNAIDYSEGKNPEEQEMKLPASMAETDAFPVPSMGSDIVEDLLDYYEDMAHKYIRDREDLNGMSQFSDWYDEQFKTLQKKKKRVASLSHNCFSIAKAFDAEQQARYLRVNKDLKNIKK